MDWGKCEKKIRSEKKKKTRKRSIKGKRMIENDKKEKP